MKFRLRLRGKLRPKWLPRLTDSWSSSRVNRRTTVRTRTRRMRATENNRVRRVFSSGASASCSTSHRPDELENSGRHKTRTTPRTTPRSSVDLDTENGELAKHLRQHGSLVRQHSLDSNLGQPNAPTARKGYMGKRGSLDPSTLKLTSCS